MPRTITVDIGGGELMSSLFKPGDDGKTGGHRHLMLWGLTSKYHQNPHVSPPFFVLHHPERLTY
jgi:hypothetical protein